ncbi:Uncharacterised protein g1983 [Pycnogonum litorale]
MEAEITYLCVIDYYSKFPVMRALRDKTASSVITNLKSVFSEYGIPEEVISDNNMPFNSREFSSFATNYCFTSITFSPTYSQSNGQVERTIGIIKQLLRKADDPYTALLAYRNTPLKGLDYSPAQLLNSRRFRTKLPISNTNLMPNVITNVKGLLQQRQTEMTKYYNRGAKDFKPLKEGEMVRIRDGKLWKPAQVKSEHETPRSYIVETDTGTVRRNRRHLKRNGNEYIDLSDPIVESDNTENDEETQSSLLTAADKDFSDTVPWHRQNYKITYTRSGRQSRPPERLNL